MVKNSCVFPKIIRNILRLIGRGMSNAEEQLIKNTISAVNNNLEGWLCHPSFISYWNNFIAKKSFLRFGSCRKDLQLQQIFFLNF